MLPKHESSYLTFSNQEALDARKEIFHRLHSYLGTEEEKERSMGLFLRGSLLARILAITEIYKLMVNIPGVILDLGTWRGQTTVICENLRAIYEPLNFNRKIIGFDTFEGYIGFADKDKPTALHQDGTYGLNGVDYANFLAELLVLHEKSNAMGDINNGKHQIIKGDIRVTMPEFFIQKPGTIVSLAFFDINAYQPTLEAFDLIWTRLVSGGILAFWQLTREVVPAEGRVYVENILDKYAHTIHRSPLYPGLCYLIKK